MATAWRAMAGLLVTLGGWTTGAPALAQAVRADAPLQVEHFDVEQVPRLEPGAALAFSVFGTPGAAARVQIEGAREGLALRETQPGVYEGTYTVGPAERIRPQARVDASLQRGRQVAHAVLAEPLQLGAEMPGMREPVREAPVTGASDGTRVAVRTPPAASVAVQDAAPAACDECAVVESVRTVAVDNRPGYVGAVSGGLLGAILGDKFADGPGRDIARVIGAIGGALVGREVERNVGRTVRYDVALRLPDGSLEIRSYAQAPPYRVGDRVRPGPVALARLTRTPARP